VGGNMICNNVVICNDVARIKLYRFVMVTCVYVCARAGCACTCVYAVEWQTVCDF